MFSSILQFFAGLVLLYLGAEGLVRFSVALARRLHITPLVIGLTIVAFGTSAPEMIVSLKTAISGQGSLSVGNVVGSNIFNIAFILGISSLIYPMKIELKILKIDIPIMVLVSILFIFFFRDREISTVDGLILFALIIIYTFFSYYRSKRVDDVELPLTRTGSSLNKYIRNIYVEILLIILSLIILVLGANFLISGSIAIAKLAGVSEAIIGLTVVAVGTSLPELATSVVAAIRRNPDIAIGNIVGSNIFNILAILGLSSMISPINAIGISKLDILVMISFSVLLMPFMWTKFRLERWEGFLLVTGYIVYIFLLVK